MSGVQTQTMASGLRQCGCSLRRGVHTVGVHKYFHEDRVDVIESGMIRFSQPAVFNDPFELRPALSKVLSEQAAKEPSANNIYSLRSLRGWMT